MAMVGLMEMMLFLLMSAAGQPTDLVTLLSPQDYFKTRGIDMSIAKMMDLAAKDPTDGATQIEQLLALRTLSEDGNFKNGANYQAQRQVLGEIAMGKKAQDKLGFAREYAQQALARIDGAKPPMPEALGARSDGLAWFPAAATMVGGIERRPALTRGPQSLMLELLKKMPPEAKKEFYKVVSSLGNVQIERVTFAFVDEGNGKGRTFARLSGRFNQAWVKDALKKAGLEGKEHKDPRGAAITMIANSGRDPAIALVGDHDVLLAGFNYSGKHEELIEQALAMRQTKQANAATGGLRATLDKLPAKAVGYMVGEFPDGVRRELQRQLGAFPKKVVAYAEHAATGIDLFVQAGLEDGEQAKTFVQAIGKLRMDGLDALQKAPPIPVPGLDVGELKNMLNTLQFEAKGTEVNIRMLLPDDALKTVILYFGLAF
jgi:hypothetical protein